MSKPFGSAFATEPDALQEFIDLIDRYPPSFGAVKPAEFEVKMTKALYALCKQQRRTA